MGARKVPRDPNNEPTRDRRFKDKTRSIVNSLLERDEIVLVGLNTYTVNPVAQHNQVLAMRIFGLLGPGYGMWGG